MVYDTFFVPTSFSVNAMKAAQYDAYIAEKSGRGFVNCIFMALIRKTDKKYSRDIFERQVSKAIYTLIKGGAYDWLSRHFRTHKANELVVFAAYCESKLRDRFTAS